MAAARRDLASLHRACARHPAGYRPLYVSWNDCSRALDSACGSNISDVTLEQLGAAAPLPVLRCENFNERIAHVPSSQLYMAVGARAHDTLATPLPRARHPCTRC
jgi:hypothetical protein